MGSRLASAIIMVNDASVGGLIDDQEAGGDADRNVKFGSRFELPIGSYEQRWVAYLTRLWSMQ